MRGTLPSDYLCRIVFPHNASAIYEGDDERALSDENTSHPFDDGDGLMGEPLQSRSGE